MALRRRRPVGRYAPARRPHVGPHGGRARLHEGTIAIAADGPFDAATSLLTVHFIARDRRLETLGQLRRRLKPGAPFVLAHVSFPQAEPARAAGFVDVALFYAGLSFRGWAADAG